MCFREKKNKYFTSGSIQRSSRELAPQMVRLQPETSWPWAHLKLFLTEARQIKVDILYVLDCNHFNLVNINQINGKKMLNRRRTKLENGVLVDSRMDDRGEKNRSP